MSLQKIRSTASMKLLILRNGCRSIFCLMLFITMVWSEATSQIKLMKTGQKVVEVCWSPNTEPDLSHYVVTIWDGKDSLTAVTTDTSRQFIVSQIADTIIARCTAVDNNGNEASSHAWTKHDILKLDFNHDDNNRIDIRDYQKFMELYRKYRGKTVSHEGEAP